MSKKVYVGNIPWATKEDELKEAFSSYGDIEEVVIIRDKLTGRSKGFGFITFAEDEAADKAIAEMDGKDLGGRQIKVSEARPMEKRE